MPRKRVAKPKPGDIGGYDPERQAAAHRLLEQAKQPEEQHITIPVRIDSKTVVLKKVKKR
jgi:hypothetical protein